MEPGPDVDGRELSRRFHADVVRPLLQSRRPGMPYAAARLGAGSEVLGLDDQMSHDHDWGPRLTLLVPGGEVVAVGELLESGLPAEYAGLPVRFPRTGSSVKLHGVEVDTVTRLLGSRLGCDPRQGLAVADWLSLTGQAVLEVTAGPVFVDDDGGLTEARGALTWYPDDLWRHLVACDWQRLDQELPLMGRAGDRGDDLGSRVIAARLVHVAMHLGFLLERRWPPYAKWLGTVFGRLPRASAAYHDLSAVLRAEGWRERQARLAGALDVLGSVQRAAGLPCTRVVTVPFWSRPYLHLDPDLVPSLLDPITDPAVRDLPRGLGSAEQRSDNVDLLVDAGRRRAQTEEEPHSTT